MTDSTNHQTVTIRPDYYGDFHCLCSDCLDTCCKGWIIEIDPAGLENWKRLSKEKHLSKNNGLPVFTDHIDTITAANGSVRYHIRLNEDKKCPFLTSDGLCSVVMVLGHEATPDICRDFPRHVNEYENLLQRTLAVRCEGVLKLIWAKDQFAYEIVSEYDAKALPLDSDFSTMISNNRDSIHQSGENINPLTGTSFPAKSLLDGILAIGNNKSVTADKLFISLFDSLYKIHLKVDALVPVDETGYKEYGQEYLTEENIKETLEMIEKSLESPIWSNNRLQALATETDFPKGSEKSPLSHLPLHNLEDYARAHHDFMYELAKSFFDSPIFGPDFEKLFYDSRKLLHTASQSTDSQNVSLQGTKVLDERKQNTGNQDARKALEDYRFGRFLSEDQEEKLKLLVLEELFTSVLSIEVMDYETILCRLQWLIVQYLVCRYAIFLERYYESGISEERFIYLVTRVFRISDLPDILKISFFDLEFVNWLWEPEHVKELIG